MLPVILDKLAEINTHLVSIDRSLSWIQSAVVLVAIIEVGRVVYTLFVDTFLEEE